MQINVQSAQVVCSARKRRCPKFNKFTPFINIAKAVVKQLINLNLPNGRRWSAEDMLLVLAYAWIRGVSIEHSSNRLNKYGIDLEPATYSIYADGRRRRAVPHQTSVNDWLRKLSLKDAEKIISKNRPKLSVLTHFGMTMLKAKPWEVAENLSKKLNLKVVAANDGMVIDIEKYRSK